MQRPESTISRGLTIGAYACGFRSAERRIEISLGTGAIMFDAVGDLGRHWRIEKPSDLLFGGLLVDQPILSADDRRQVRNLDRTIVAGNAHPRLAVEQGEDAAVEEIGDDRA